MRGTPPASRTGHSATVLADRYIVISGGYNPFTGAASSPSAQAIDDNDSIRIHFYDDEFVLDTITWCWHSLEIPKPSKLPVHTTGTLQEISFLPDELDGSVGCSVLKIDPSLLGDSSQDESSDSTGLVVVTALSYGGLNCNGIRSKNFSVRKIDISEVVRDNPIPAQSTARNSSISSPH